MVEDLGSGTTITTATINQAQEKMTPEQFVYWLQGFFEMSEATELTENQVKMLKDHLAIVFHKVTPLYSEFTTEDVQVPYLANPGITIC